MSSVVFAGVLAFASSTAPATCRVECHDGWCTLTSDAVHRSEDGVPVECEIQELCRPRWNDAGPSGVDWGMPDDK